MALKWLVSLIFGPLDVIGMWFNEDQRESIISRDVGLHFQILKTTLHSIVNSWEVLCIQLRNQQPCTSDNYNSIKGGPIVSALSANVFNHNFAIATHVVLLNLIGRS